jgi:hypothetical protein
MLSPLPRREFFKRLGQFGVACAGCALAYRLGAESAAGPGVPAAAPKLTSLKTRAYCGLICGDWCQLFTATKTGDPAAKRAVYDSWKWKEKFGVEFDPHQVFCHGCKAPGKPVNVAHARCTVLKCSAGRRFDSCLQCRRLAECDQELWKNYPDFRQQMLKLQQEYVSAEGLQLS